MIFLPMLGAVIAMADLPVGSAPKPLETPHFPDQVHAFVWRNWPLIDPGRIASVIGAKKEDVLRMGHGMGLSDPPKITEELKARSYLTVIRRNWHLLPYDQLLALLGWTKEQMEFTLREDDFLFVKLGSLKPTSPPLRYSPPTAETLRREREIAQILRAEFPEDLPKPSEPLFAFVKKLSAPMKATKPAPAVGGQPRFSPRFCYSYFALYGDPLLEKNADPYPDGYLARLAASGVNGVWLQGVLYKLAPFPWDPAMSARYHERLASLRSLVARAKRHGIGIYLYLNEPRAMPLSFFATRPELKGVTEGDHATLCTSRLEVQAYLRDSIASICRAVPDLKGFFTITASENLTNCWSHHRGMECPRCAKRAAPDVIAEVNRLVVDGIKQAGAKTELIAWDWGWKDEWSADAIRALPKEAALQSVSEWSLPIVRGGINSEVGEYSISAIGPGPRATRHWQIAKENGLKSMAKIQANNTWEISTVPYIPAVENVARHAANLRKSPAEGLMLGWTLGGHPSPNLEVIQVGGEPEQGMARVAQRRFGPALASVAVSAWKGFSAAFREYPYHIGVVYTAPTQLGPANPLWAEPTRYSATMVGFPYDDLDNWRGPFPPEVFAAQFEKMAVGFETAIRKARTEMKSINTATSQIGALEEELGVAEACAVHFRSVANQTRFVLARRALGAAKTADEARTAIINLEVLLESELAQAKRLHALQGRDSRLGFEASNQYAYIPQDLLEKVLNCHDLLDRWLPVQRAKWGL